MATKAQTKVTSEVTKNTPALNTFEKHIADMGESFVKNGKAAFAAEVQNAYAEKKYDFGATQESIDTAATKLVGIYASSAKMTAGSLKSFKSTLLTYVKLAVLERLTEVREVTSKVTENLGDGFKIHAGQDPFDAFAKLNRRVTEGKAAGKPVKLDLKTVKALVKKGDKKTTPSTPEDQAKARAASVAEAIKTLEEGATDAQKKAIAAMKKAFGVK